MTAGPSANTVDNEGLCDDTVLCRTEVTAIRKSIAAGDRLGG